MKIKHILLTFLLAMSNQAYAYNDALFHYNGMDHHEAELSSELKQSSYQIKLEYYKRMQKLADVAFLQAYIDQEAKKRNIGSADLINELFPTPKPTETELKSFYDKNKSDIPYPYEKIKDKIAYVIANDLLKKSRATFIKNLKKTQDFKFLIQPPVAPIANININGYPFKGNPDAKVTIVKFADYQCSHCRNASVALERIFPRYKDKIKYVYMDFPINRSGISRIVSEGAVCADKQGKFWEYNQLAFEKQRTLTKTSPEKFAQTLALDASQFSQCLASKEAKDKVNQAEKEAIKHNIKSTPTIFINGIKLEAEDYRKDIEDAIKQALNSKK